MKLNNYLSLNLFSLIGYIYLLLLSYMICDYYSDINIFYLPLDDICSIHALCFLITLSFLALFLVEYFLYRTKNIEKKFTSNSIIYKIFFYVGFLSSSINILFYILFFCLAIYNTN